MDGFRSKPIVVAGGCYFEACEAPYWRALYGSGGRAAHALVGQVPVELHTYFPTSRQEELRSFVAAGIDLRIADSETALAFAYFHPLSDPVLAPPRSSISRQTSIRAEGDAVLRFGFVEGDAIVDGRRVVYDPQTVGNFEPFRQNGSSAQELAIVLNAHELRAAAREDDLAAAARVLLDDGAEVVVAKNGVHGAFVHTRDRPLTWIPAYWSESVFKIGTGDVFSAAFTHLWGYLGRDPIVAASAASRSVASYAASRTLPLPRIGGGSDHRPIGAPQGSLVHLVGSRMRLSDRWLCEEAAWRLQQLGARVRRWDGEGGDVIGDGPVLLLADHLCARSIAAMAAEMAGSKLVAFSETDVDLPEGAFRTSDFATALYWVCWLSSDGADTLPRVTPVGGEQSGHRRA